MNSLGSKISHPKLRGEWAELCFMARAAEHSLRISKPYGDSAPYDFAVESRGRFLRVQVKSTAFRRSSGYMCHVTQFGRKHYDPKAVDFFAIFIIPENVWYIFPADAITCGKSNLILEPSRKGQKHEPYKEAWHLLKEGKPSKKSKRKKGSPDADSGSTDDRQPATDNCSSNSEEIKEMTGAVDPPPAVGFDPNLLRRRMEACFARLKGR